MRCSWRAGYAFQLRSTISKEATRGWGATCPPSVFQNEKARCLFPCFLMVSSMCLARTGFCYQNKRFWLWWIPYAHRNISAAFPLLRGPTSLCQNPTPPLWSWSCRSIYTILNDLSAHTPAMACFDKYDFAGGFCHSAFPPYTIMVLFWVGD